MISYFLLSSFGIWIPFANQLLQKTLVKNISKNCKVVVPLFPYSSSFSFPEVNR